MKKETELTPQLLSSVEEMFAEGLTMQEVADVLCIPFPTLRGYASANLEFRKAVKAGENRAQLKTMDKKRRNSLTQAATWFIPTETDLERIEELARLSWSEPNIAKSLNLTPSIWGQSKKKYPKIAEALERGIAQSSGRSHQELINTWRPTPEQLKQVTELAGKGYTPPVISRQLGLGAQFIEKHLSSIPELQEAYLNGLADWEMMVTDRLNEDIKMGRTSPSLFYALKSRAKRHWSDAAPAAAAVAEKPGINTNSVAFDIVKQKEPAIFDRKAAVLKKAAMKKKKAQE